MDGKRFDQIAKSVANSRRGFLRGALATVIGGMAGVTGLSESEAATKRKVGEICRKNGDCSTGRCGPADAAGRRRCACTTPADCPKPVAGSICTAATCSESGVCGFGVTPGAECSDGNPCTVNDRCDERGLCAGEPKDCDDSNACTGDSCDPETGKCINTAISCDDANLCTIDSCDPLVGCVNSPKNCDDNNACTVDTCDSGSGCIHTPIACGTGTDDSTCCGWCTGVNGCCVNGACGACEACNCPHGLTAVTLAEGGTIYSNGGSVCISPCTTNAECGCGQYCASTFTLCLAGTPVTDCNQNSNGGLPVGAYCAFIGVCTPTG